MATILERIRTYKLEEVAARKAARSLEAINAAARAAPAPRPFARALAEACRDGYGLIAEIKKASPSKGLIRDDFNPSELARAYAAGGATCLSVLTDTPSFQGADAYLTEARAASGLPVLRKDFLYDPWQVYEARALGADCILIIMASVSDTQAAELQAAAQDCGIDVLVEVHDRAELDRASQIDSRMIGINNRNLHTFEVNIDVTRELVRHVPADRLVVSESGLSGPGDLAELARYGVRCFLIGETLMRSADVAAATRAMLSRPHTASRSL